MKQTLFILSSSIIKKNRNTILLERIIEDKEDWEFERAEYFLDKEFLIPAGDKKYMPIENIESVISAGSCRFNSRFLYFLSRYRIPLHVINLHGKYIGAFYPAGKFNSSPTLLKQIDSVTDINKKLTVAKSIAFAAAQNSIKILRYYNKRRGKLHEEIDYIEQIEKLIAGASSVEELLGIEGIIKRIYYSAWNKIFVYPVEFNKRIKRPAPDFVNALISYGNAILYSFLANLIYLSKLYPEVGYIHAPGENKFSLVYDLADIYKPVIVDRAIFKLVNKNVIAEKDFTLQNNSCIINNEAKKIFTAELEKRFFDKKSLPGSANKLSLRSIVKKDLFKLVNFISGNCEKLKFYETPW